MKAKDYDIDEPDPVTVEPRVFDFDGMGDHSDGDYPEQVLTLQRPVCPRCFLELPVSMVCGNC